MQTWLIAVAILVVAVVVLAAVGAWLWNRRRRTERLSERFGPEYQATMESSGSRSAAERELEAREERVHALTIVELAPRQRAAYAEAWRTVQEEFVDDPAASIAGADRLVQQVMRERGYPTEDFEQRAADISVNHPDVVSEYRAAHAIAERHARAGVETEELRRALVHYRGLFAELLGAPIHEPELTPGGTR